MIERQFPYIPWHEARYRNATKWFASPWQHQIYRSLCIQYCLDGPLKDDEIELRGICDMASPEWDGPWSRYWPDIKARKFTVKGGYLINDFGDWVRAWQRKEPQQKSTAGKAGAEARWRGTKPEPKKADGDVAAVREAVDAYNAAAEAHGWPRCDKLTEQRRKKLRARLGDLTTKDGPPAIEGWTAALERVTASDFLMGRTPRDEKHKDWKFNIDFLLRDEKFTKLMEGGFENRKPANGYGAGPAGIGKGRPVPTREERRAAILAGARAAGLEFRDPPADDADA